MASRPRCCGRLLGKKRGDGGGRWRFHGARCPRIVDRCALPRAPHPPTSKDKRSVKEAEVNDELISKVNKIVGDDYKKLNNPKDKHSRYGDISDYKNEIAEKFEED